MEWDLFDSHEDFIELINNENINEASFLYGSCELLDFTKITIVLNKGIDINSRYKGQSALDAVLNSFNIYEQSSDGKLKKYQIEPYIEFLLFLGCKKEISLTTFKEKRNEYTSEYMQEFFKTCQII